MYSFLNFQGQNLPQKYLKAALMINAAKVQTKPLIEKAQVAFLPQRYLQMDLIIAREKDAAKVQKAQVAFLPQRYLQMALIIAREKDATEVHIIPITRKAQASVLPLRYLQVALIAKDKDAIEVKVQLLLIVKEAQVTLPTEIQV